MSLSNLDLTGDGVEEIAIATTRGLQILQHDIEKVQVNGIIFFDNDWHYFVTIVWELKPIEHERPLMVVSFIRIPSF